MSTQLLSSHGRPSRPPGTNFPPWGGEGQPARRNEVKAGERSSMPLSTGEMTTFWSASLTSPPEESAFSPVWPIELPRGATLLVRNASQPCARLRSSSVSAEFRYGAVGDKSVEMLFESGMDLTLSRKPDTSDQKRLHIPPAVHRKTRKQRRSEDPSPAWKMLRL